MSHQKYLEWIQLSLYDELNPEEQGELKKHLTFCRDCKAEYESQKRFKDFISNKNLVEDSLLYEARAQLRKSLNREIENASFWKNLLLKLNEFFYRDFKLIFGAAAILLVGVFAGYLIFNNPQEQKNDLLSVSQEKDQPVLTEGVQISNFRFIDQDASDGEVEFIFDAVKPVHIKGDINDDRVKNILTHSMLNEQNPGVRLNSINAIEKQVINETDKEIKEAAITVIKYDENPGVRREALKLLNKFSFDKSIINTLLYVLMNDKNSALRIEAINSLIKARESGVTFDEQELEVFKNKMDKDENYYIRLQAKNVIEEKN